MTGVRLTKDRACDGKVHHTSRHNAELAIRALRARDRRAGKHLVAYACPHGPHWHTGHLPTDAREDT